MPDHRVAECAAIDLFHLRVGFGVHLALEVVRHGLGRGIVKSGQLLMFRLRFVETDESTRRGVPRMNCSSTEAGKTACYALRWVSTRGGKGPWSEVAAATVAT